MKFLTVTAALRFWQFACLVVVVRQRARQRQPRPSAAHNRFPKWMSRRSNRRN